MDKSYDPRWKHVHGYIGPPEISFDELMVGIDPNDFVEFWLEMHDGNLTHYRRQLFSKEAIEDIKVDGFEKWMFDHMVVDIDSRIGDKEPYDLQNPDHRI